MKIITSGGGGIASVVADTTPQLGGNLDIQANTIAGNGGTTGITISANGEVSMTSQPAVSAINSVTDANVTGNGAWADLDFDTEIFDQNSDFASDTFTAPVTGRYLVVVGIALEGTTTAKTSVSCRFVTTARTWQIAHDMSARAEQTGESAKVSAVVDMAATNTLTVDIQANGESSDVVDVVGNAAPRTWISIVLLA